MDHISLVLGLKHRQSWAYNKLDLEYRKDMMRIAKRILRNTEDAEDAVSQGFAKLYEDIHRMTGNSPLALRAFLRESVYQQSIQILRARKTYKSYLKDFQPDKAEMPGSDQLLHGKDIRSVLHKLKQEYRIVVLLLLDGLIHEEIAEVLQISQATSEWRFKQAKKLLKPLLLQKGITDATR